MVMLLPNQPDQQAPVKYGYAISAHEVTLTQFIRSLTDKAGSRDSASISNSPIHSVSLYQAAEYCNWLSEQEGMDEDQWVYVANQHGNYDAGMRVKDNALQLEGYRLPTPDEWIGACRAGTTSRFSFGEPDSLLHRYGHDALSAGGRRHPVGQLLPNDAGLFDMHGNVSEWRLRKAWMGKVPITRETTSAAGGSFREPPEGLRSDTTNQWNPALHRIHIGFRVARTHVVTE